MMNFALLALAASVEVAIGSDSVPRVRQATVRAEGGVAGAALVEAAPQAHALDLRGEYTTVTTGWLVRGHATVGNGHFGAATLVTRDGDASGREYVWKRFGDNSNASTIHAAAQMQIQLKAMACPHVMVALDVNPAVATSRRYLPGAKVEPARPAHGYTESGFIFEKYDGNAEAWVQQAKEEDPSLLCECGPSFGAAMLAAVNCLASHQTVHTDLKLDNVLFRAAPGRRCPDWAVTDFDLARHVGEPPLFWTPPLTALYHAGRYAWAPLTGREDYLELVQMYHQFDPSAPAVENVTVPDAAALPPLGCWQGAA